MSTARNNIIQNRFLLLAQLNEQIFHVNDLANLWQINNKNNLHTTLKRYTKNGLLHRIYRGLYSILPVNKIDPYLLGTKAIHNYCYISTETILSRAGIILQNINTITLISNQTKRISIGDNNYYCRQLNDQYLFNPAGIKEINGVKIASTERAIADLLYFNSTHHFDAGKLIEWKKVKQIQEEVGYL